MARVETPDTLIGVGEGGSRVVYRFMQQRWILDEVLEDLEEENQEQADNLSAVTIDSATSDDFHGEKASEVENVIEAAINDSPHRKVDHYLEFHGPKIIPEMIPLEWKNQNLTSPNVEDLAKHNKNKLHSWWMEEGREPIQTIQKEGFAGGVQRLRSMSKALYHISNYTEQDLLPQQLGDDVCLVATLGGGTGSGMFMDLASNLSEQANIHFFGILPREGKGGRERTNANAALSEIEFAELNGDSPFASITLIPYSSSIQHDDEEFEMAVVRTILAQQQMNPHDEYKELQPADNDKSSAPEFAPFQVAVPHTVQFDLKVIEDSKTELDKYLQQKEEELQRESDLYSVVEEYLGEHFEDTNVEEVMNEGQTADMSFRDGQGMREAIRLRERLEEDLLGTLLTQNAMKIAGLSDLIEDLQSDFDRVLDDESKFDYSGDATTGEQAATYIEKAPDYILGEINSGAFTEYGEADGRPYQLLKVLRKEVENIKRRRDLWKAVTQITSDIWGLDEKDAKLIRRGLLEVTLDTDQTYLDSAITNPSVDDQIANLRKERDSKREKGSELEEFWGEVCENISQSQSNWYQDAGENAEKLANINKNKKTVQKALEDIISSINTKVSTLAGGTQQEIEGVNLSFAALSPFGGDENDEDVDEVEHIGQLNDMLSDMGVAKIDHEQLKDDFDSLKEAATLKAEHGTRKTVTVIDNTEEFSVQAESALRNNWFELNKETFNVEHDFEPELVADSFRRDDNISDAKEGAIEEIVEVFKEEFLNERNQLMSYSQHNINIPEEITSSGVQEALKSELQETDKTDKKELLNEVFSVDKIDASKISTEEIDNSGSSMRITEKLVTGYLKPIEDYYHETIHNRLEQIEGRNENYEGKIYLLKQLKGLAEGNNSVSVRLPQEYDMEPGEETYGNDFAKSYSGDYEIETERDIDYSPQESPYKSVEKTDEKYLTDDPDDIGDTDILEDDVVEKSFEAATKNIFRSEEHAPFNKLDLIGEGEHGGGAYEHLRVRQAYLSRAFESGKSVDSVFDKVYEKYKDDDGLAKAGEKNDVYKSKAFTHGWEDDITMVTFIGGIFLDNISLMTGSDGYCEEYKDSMGENSFMGSQHTIGMGGRWEKWTAVKEWAEEELGGDTDELKVGEFGAWVYRSETRVPDAEFVEEILKAYENDEGDAKELFLDMTECETYPSTLLDKIDLS